MSVSELSASSQNYLKVIWSLEEWSADAASTSAIADKLGVRTSTASDAIRRLVDQGLVDHTPYGGVHLTERGRRYAVEMIRRHRLIETLLVRVLDFTWDEVHDEADLLEHAVSDRFIERADQVLGYPGRDPHGDPIPRADGTVERLDVVPLAALPPGTPARVERIADHDSSLLQFFSTRGITVGAVVETRPAEPYSETIGVVVRGRDGSTALGSAALHAVWVKAESQPWPASPSAADPARPSSDAAGTP